jgi:hypothetical protein
MDTYAGLLAEIRAQPAFYLGEPPLLSKLHLLVYGYWLACLNHNIPDTEGDFDFFKFNDWLRARYPDSLPDQVWAVIIRERFGDETGLFKFFELYDEFTQN